MLAMIFEKQDTAVTLPIVTAAYLGLLFFGFRSSQCMENKLLWSGLLTAVFAFWCEQMSETAASVQLRTGQAGIHLGGDAVGMLSRISVVLILSGVAVAVIRSWPQPPVSNSAEADHANSK